VDAAAAEEDRLRAEVQAGAAVGQGGQADDAEGGIAREGRVAEDHDAADAVGRNGAVDIDGVSRVVDGHHLAGVAALGGPQALSGVGDIPGAVRGGRLDTAVAQGQEDDGAAPGQGTAREDGGAQGVILGRGAEEVLIAAEAAEVHAHRGHVAVVAVDRDAVDLIQDRRRGCRDGGRGGGGSQLHPAEAEGQADALDRLETQAVRPCRQLTRPKDHRVRPGEARGRGRESLAERLAVDQEPHGAVAR